MKGMITCKVCGRDFPLLAEEHYIARSCKPEASITISEIWTSKEKEPTQYDAIDCPHCGCQTILQERKRILWPCTEDGECERCNLCMEENPGEEEENE